MFSNSRTQPKPTDKKLKEKYILRITIGDLEFSNLNGDIITKPMPYLVRSTIRGSKFKCLLNDKNNDLLQKITQYKKATINIGFGSFGVNPKTVPQIEGLIWEVVKNPPNSVILVVTDIKFELQKDQGVTIESTKKETESSKNQRSSQEFESLLNFAESNLVNSGNEVDSRNKLLLNLINNQKSNNDPIYTFFTNPQESNFSFDSSVKIQSEEGFIKTQRSDLKELTKTAQFQVDKVVSDINGVKQVSPSNREKSDVVLDYLNKRFVFVNNPKIGKRSSSNRRSGQGTVTVKGWNVNNKGTVGSTAVSQNTPPKPSSNKIEIPEWGEIDLTDKIIEELPFTWADATKNGNRVPGEQEIEQIINIAKAVVPLFNNSSQNWTVTSWYRPRDVNRRIGGASNSKHIEGHAIDFHFPGINGFFKSQVEGQWDGGHALKPGSFIHLDLGSKRTWSY